MAVLDVATLIILAIVGIISIILGTDHKLFGKKPTPKVRRILTYVVLLLIVI